MRKNFNTELKTQNNKIKLMLKAAVIKKIIFICHFKRGKFSAVVELNFLSFYVYPLALIC
jgi:hypothetical protein